MKRYWKLFCAYVRCNAYLLLSGMRRGEQEAVFYSQDGKTSMIVAITDRKFTIDGSGAQLSFRIKRMFYPEVSDALDYPVAYSSSSVVEPPTIQVRSIRHA